MIRRISFLAIGSVLSCGAVQAQIHSIPTRAKPPIELKLRSVTLMACVGSSLSLDLKITNHGSKKFSVDKYNIGTSFTYRFLGDREPTAAARWV